MMRKSSRFWWLHGAILLSAVLGCKSSNSGGSFGGPVPGGPPVVTGSSGMPVGSPMTTTTTYPSMGSGTYSPMPSSPGGQSMAPSMGGGSYPMPSTASSMSQGFSPGIR